MIDDGKLIGEHISLACIEETDVTDEYVAWLEDPKVNAFLETRWTLQSKSMVSDFVREVRASDHSILFTIRLRANDKHVGNIKLGPINWNHLYADISYFIGDIDSWGKGYAREAVALIVRYGFDVIKLHKLTAGYYASNKGSKKVLESNGFIVEGISKKLVRTSGGVWDDAVRVGLLYDDYMNLRSDKAGC